MVASPTPSTEKRGPEDLCTIRAGSRYTCGMTRTDKVAVGLAGAFATVVVAKLLSDALTPKPAPPFSQEAERIDRHFYRALLGLAADQSKPAGLRMKAKAGAWMFKAKWLDKGHAGCALKTKKKLRIYGEWCGANHGDGAPIDELDALCRAHDIGRAAAFRRCGIDESCVYA